MKPNEKDDRFRVLIADENLDYKRNRGVQAALSR